MLFLLLSCNTLKLFTDYNHGYLVVPRIVGSQFGLVKRITPKQNISVSDLFSLNLVPILESGILILISGLSDHFRFASQVCLIDWFESRP